jgi:hypothetical protein
MVGSDGGTLAKSKKLRHRAGKRRYTPMDSFVEPTSENSTAPEPSLSENASLPMFGEYLAVLRCNDPKCNEPMPLTREQLANRVGVSFDTKGGHGVYYPLRTWAPFPNHGLQACYTRFFGVPSAKLSPVRGCTAYVI